MNGHALDLLESMAETSTVDRKYLSTGHADGTESNLVNGNQKWA